MLLLLLLLSVETKSTPCPSEPSVGDRPLSEGTEIKKWLAFLVSMQNSRYYIIFVENRASVSSELGIRCKAT